MTPMAAPRALWAARNHVVAGDVQASHVALVDLIVAAAVTPVYRRNQLRQPTENLHNPQPSREYLKVFMNLVIP